jgi:putative phage-type endonuclease
MIIQGSPAWFAARAGKVTASRVADVIARTKTGYSTSRANYAAELLCERLTGACEPGYVSPAMQWGTDHEPHARALYEKRQGVEVWEVGFVDHPEIPMSGASPDGLVGDDGLVEFKCPLTATHLDTLVSDALPTRYVTQIQWQLACCGREWCDFVSYDPRLPEAMQLYIRRVPRDVSMILELETEVSAFLREIDSRLAQLSARYPLRQPEAA